MVSATPGSLNRSTARSRCTNATICAASAAGAPGTRRCEDRALARRVGKADPVVEAAALDRVVDLARAVAGEHDDRRASRAFTVPSSGIVIWKSASTSSRNASNGSSARSSSSISSTGGAGARRRSPAAADARSGTASLNRSRASALAVRVAPSRFGQADLHHLPRRSSIRTRRRRGRALRSTAGGSAARPSSAASVLAISVLPVPGSPSRNSGRSRRSARNTAVASARSAT